MKSFLIANAPRGIKKITRRHVPENIGIIASPLNKFKKSRQFDLVLVPASSPDSLLHIVRQPGSSLN